jgi:tricorn protease
LKRLLPIAFLLVFAPFASVSGQTREPIRLASQPALSPDGSTLAFTWAGDIWTVSSAGGRARPLTRNTAVDHEPEFSPDGKQIAFSSDRQGSFHPYVMPAEGGPPRQVGFHSAGYSVEGWTADGRSLLISAGRDHFWRNPNRFFFLTTEDRSAEAPLFDAAGDNGSLSPDGKQLLFTREGAPWWRKGYHGSQDSQVWLFDLGAKTFTKVLNPSGGALWPIWRPDGQGFYYVGINKGNLNLREHDLKSGKDRPVTDFEDDSVVYPCISRDGSTIVFRHLFDFYRVRTGSNEAPTRIDIYHEGDATREPIERRALTSATDVAFSKDGLEIAFIAGGDLWVMDTELKEPRQITRTPEEERDPAFSPKGETILFVSDKGGQADLWKAERGDSAKDWWRNSTFKLDPLSHDAEVESTLKFSPDGSRLAFLKGRGDLWVSSPDGKEAKRLVASFEPTHFDWSPDGKWVVYSKSDDDFNEDIWVAPVDGSREPFNLSRHPDNESNPVWSPDGSVIAFTGRRIDTEVDIYFVWLKEEEDDKTSRERTLEKAIEKMKARKTGGRPASGSGRPGRGPGAAGKAEDAAPKGDTSPATETPESPKKPVPEVVIDFERIHERIRHVSIPDSTETGLFWSPDSKKLAFTGTVDGKPGVYTIEFPEDLKPKPLTTQTGSQAKWLESGNQIVWLSGGVPASFSASGTASRETSYRFRALQEVNWPDRYRAAFDLCWRTMRDRYYDERLGNRNWDAVRRKYSDMAAKVPDRATFATVVQLMLGELNGSHLGFMASTGQGPAVAPGPGPRRGPRGPATPTTPGAEGSGEARWNVTTAHFGLRFEPGYKGPGLKVKDVIPGTPADHKATRIMPGDIVLAVDGTTIDPALDLTKVLNGPADRDMTLTVRNAEGKEREVTLRPTSFPAARTLLYDKWVKDNRKKVEELSKGTLGYLHIQGMSLPSFYKFEEELYSAGAGKAGLIIDVRENGGGSTADHLLTALTQPAHAITIPRGGGQGYPQDRRVYATWTKPIVVLCNQNSFSNAEIFSHAIKTLKRGKLVGVPTAGGVISTGATSIMDLGTLRLPTRGWFILDTGEDMELNGAVPHYILWPDPADFAQGVDKQLDKAVEVLSADVKEEANRPRPKLRKATERGTDKVLAAP